MEIRPLPALRFANFLSPLLQSTYEAVAAYAGLQLGRAITFHTGQDLEEFASGEADVGFVCGLQYVRMKEMEQYSVELLAAPILYGKQYQQKPIYYSAVVVRSDSTFLSFADLAGCTWAYNERTSHSGWNLVSFSLLVRGLSLAYFGEELASGSHLNSLQMVLDGRADATAIDSHVLDVALQRNHALAMRVRIIELLGPSPIPPIVVRKTLSVELKQRLAFAFFQMHNDPRFASFLWDGHIQRFAPIADEQYDVIRGMLRRVEARELGVC